MSTENLFSPTQAAALAGMSVPTITRRLRKGRGPQTRLVGRARVITEAVLQAWLATVRR